MTAGKNVGMTECVRSLCTVNFKVFRDCQKDHIFHGFSSDKRIFRCQAAVECQINPVFLQHFQQFIGTCLCQLEIDSRIFLFESDNHRRKNIGIEIVCTADSDFTCFKGRQIIDLLLHFLFQIMNFVIFADVDFSCFSQFQCPSASVKQLHSDSFFRSFDSQRQCGLSDVKLFSCF